MGRIIRFQSGLKSRSCRTVKSTPKQPLTTGSTDTRITMKSRPPNQLISARQRMSEGGSVSLSAVMPVVVSAEMHSKNVSTGERCSPAR